MLLLLLPSSLSPEPPLPTLLLVLITDLHAKYFNKWHSLIFISILFSTSGAQSCSVNLELKEEIRCIIWQIGTSFAFGGGGGEELLVKC